MCPNPVPFPDCLNSTALIEILYGCHKAASDEDCSRSADGGKAAVTSCMLMDPWAPARAGKSIQRQGWI